MGSCPDEQMFKLIKAPQKNGVVSAFCCGGCKLNCFGKLRHVEIKNREYNLYNLRKVALSKSPFRLVESSPKGVCW